MGWGTPLWSLGGHGIYVTGDTGWNAQSGDAEHHVLESDETTIHDVGRPSDRRTWRGLVVNQATRDALIGHVGNNMTYVTPMVGDITGTCRIMSASGKSVQDTGTATTPKWTITVELMKR